MFQVQGVAVGADPGRSRVESTILGSDSQSLSLHPDLWLSQTINVHGAKERRRNRALYQKDISQSSQYLQACRWYSHLLSRPAHIYFASGSIRDNGTNLFSSTGSNKHLDSSLKRHNAFIKKVRQSVGAENRDQLLKDIETLLLEKHVDELDGAVLEGISRCKSERDIWSAVEVCFYCPSYCPTVRLTRRMGVAGL